MKKQLEIGSLIDGGVVPEYEIGKPGIGVDFFTVLIIALVLLAIVILFMNENRTIKNS